MVTSKIPEQARKTWIWDGEFQYTASFQLIYQELLRLKIDATWLELRLPGYRSSPTILVDFSRQSMVVDKPVDWPVKTNSSDLTVVYQRNLEPWNFLKTRLIRVENRDLILTFPILWSILERRRFYRVQCTSDCRIAFNLQKEKGKKVHHILPIVDVSIEGAGVLTEPGFVTENFIKMHDKITDVKLFLYLADSDKEYIFSVADGGEVRWHRTIDRGRKLRHRFGLQLYTDEKEKNLFSKYIRKRELEIIRIK